MRTDVPFECLRLVRRALCWVSPSPHPGSPRLIVSKVGSYPCRFRIDVDTWPAAHAAGLFLFRWIRAFYRRVLVNAFTPPCKGTAWEPAHRTGVSMRQSSGMMMQ